MIYASYEHKKSRGTSNTSTRLLYTRLHIIIEHSYISNVQGVYSPDTSLVLNVSSLFNFSLNLDCWQGNQKPKLTSSIIRVI